MNSEHPEALPPRRGEVASLHETGAQAQVTAERPNAGISPYRWLLLTPFLYGMLVSPTAHKPVGAACYVVALISTVAVLLRLGRGSSRDLWSWILLLIFIDGNFVKSLWIERHINDTVFIRQQLSPSAVLHPETVQQGLVVITAAYVALCLVILVYRFSFNTTYADEDTSRPMLWRVRNVEWATFVAYLVLSYIQRRYGFGVLGLATQHLPARLDTVVTRTRADVVPALLVLCIWLEDRGDKGRAWRPVIMLAAAGVVDAFITTSRGGVTNYLIPAVLLWIVTRRLTRQRILVLAGAGALAVVLFPVITDLRIAVISLNSGRVVASNHDFGLASMLGYAQHFFFRVGGADGVYLAYGHSPSTLSVSRLVSFLVSPGGDAPYYTADIARILIPGEAVAPGFPGAFMLVGSLSAVCGLTVVYASAVAATWKRLARCQIGPVAIAAFGGWLKAFTIDGTLTGADIVSLVLALLAVQVLYGHLVVPTASQPVAAPVPARASSRD